MRSLLPLVLCSLLPSALTAQNFVTNGDFANGITGWTETGFSHMPGVETFDVTGLGPTSCYGAGHGGQALPTPYPPNSIKQQVLVLPGVPLEFRVDICVNKATTGTNADAGTFWAEINGVEIARVAFGSYLDLEFARARLTTQFVHATGGMLDLEIFMHRRFLTNATTPRARVTNISLELATGPTFTFLGQRRLGATRTIGMIGEANALAATFLALGRTNGVSFPGVNGTLFLDLATTATFFSGVLDANGVHTQQFTVPNNTGLVGTVFWAQAAHLSGGTTPFLGLDQFLQFNQ